ncbi:MAG: hypothetical protein ABSG89_11760 [Bacteroidales bacterium]|jgi:hypothetical protein
MEENVMNSKMKKHVTVVGAINIGFGILGLIGAIIVFFVLHFARGFIPSDGMPANVFTLISGLFVILPVLIAVFATLDLIGGIGLLSFQSWSRYLVIVMSALGILNIPIGTLKGVYSLWVLLQDETVKLFEKK